MTKTDCIQNCIDNGNWICPEGRRLSMEVRMLKQSTPVDFVPCAGCKDYTSWNGKNIQFTVKNAMQVHKEKDIYEGQDGEVGRQVWCKVLNLSFVRKNMHSLAEELSWMSSHWSDATFPSRIKRLSLAVTVYHIWRARNLIMFQPGSVIAISLVAAIREDMQTIIAAWRMITKTNANSNLVLEWNLDFNCLKPV
ncbi:hypothetical protein ACH5RR_012686 [Cinchona calisaya]|uniref:Uncharacterized protein n=1 Tax=Cinchona calisaya TaxID=153742 RepID=A0ABD3AC36_9GENT